MSKRKCVSAEEKKARMMQLFYERKEFFQLKDLEKIAPKEKGIIVNAVKDVVEGLVDEGLVDTDKIGTSVYYWAFPSKSINVRKLKVNELTKTYEQISKKLKITNENIDKLKTGREESSERNKVLDEIVDLQIERDELKKELHKYKDNDPKILTKMQEQTQPLKEAANRWTDNIFSIKSWCSRKFNTDTQMLDKQFGIPSDLDYIE